MDGCPNLKSFEAFLRSSLLHPLQRGARLVDFKFSAPVILGSFVVITAACTETKTDTSNPNTSPPVVNPPVSDDGGAQPIISKCTTPTGPGTKHSGSLASDNETWTANDSPHIIDFTLTIDANKTLTLEPCAVVRITKNQGVYVRGKLIAEGAADRTITIEGAEAEPWTVIEASGGATSEIRLAYTSITGGGFANGSAPDTFGMLDIRGNQEDPTQGRLHVDHVTLKGSASLGLLLREGGGLSSTSKELTITGSGSYPIATWARAAGSIPTGTFTGNKTDEILIEGAGVRDAIREDMTLANRGVPYRVKGTSMNVGAPTGMSKTTLTIEAGVTLRFSKGSRLLMDASTSTDPANGILKAIGTPLKPIVFTSAEVAPAAGDWVGLLFEALPDANNKIDFARVSYAGGDSGISSFDCPSPANPGFTNHGAIIIYGGRPSSAFVTNTTIESSAGDGIIRGWTGDETDFLPSNTFTGVARCNQTFPKPTVGQCPSPAPCPKS